MKKTSKKPHLAYEDRVVIEKMLKANKKQKEIESILLRGVATLSEEIKRGRVDGVYTAEKAHHKAYIRQYNKKKGCFKVSMDTVLYKHVTERIEQRVSPEDISAETNNKKNTLPYASPRQYGSF